MKRASIGTPVIDINESKTHKVDLKSIPKPLY